MLLMERQVTRWERRSEPAAGGPRAGSPVAGIRKPSPCRSFVWPELKLWSGRSWVQLQGRQWEGQTHRLQTATFALALPTLRRRTAPGTLGIRSFRHQPSLIALATCT